MKVDLVSIKEVIAINKLQKVTNPIVFGRGAIPTPDGLLSTEIFGVTSTERKETFAYIDLHGYFFHPKTYKEVKRLDRRFESIVAGTKKYIISEDGGLIQDEENGQTGLKFLYDNWEKIKFKRNNSNARNERINFIESYDKNHHFTRYWIIMPAFYRDVNFKNHKGGKLSHNELTDKYSKLLKYANLLETVDFDFMMYNTQYTVQETLVDIYNFIKSKQEKKGGNLRKNLLGKSVDYGARAVISAPQFDYSQKMLTSFKYSGIPLPQLCSLFYPFLQYYLKRWFDMKQNELNGYYENKKVADLTMYYNDNILKKQIDKFVFSYSDRFERVVIPFVDEKESNQYFKFEGEDKNGNKIERDLTWCDIIYQSMVEATADKHVWISRYPILDYFGTFPSRISVMSTKKTLYMKVNGKEYDAYPNIDLNMSKSDVSTYFLDTVTMSNVYLDMIGGDYKLPRCSL